MSDLSLASLAEPTPQEQTHYVLPLLWSLAYALTDKQWQGVRVRHKQLHPEWERCDCPNRCKSHALDEHLSNCEASSGGLRDEPLTNLRCRIWIDHRGME